MFRFRQIQIVALSFGMVLLASSAFADVHREAALGSAGELYEVKPGTYAQLFPDGNEAAASDPVLALDIARPGSPVERLLVPETRGEDVEGSPSLIFEGGSNVLFLVWEVRIHSIHSILKLVSYDGSDWSSPIQVTRNPSSLKSSPQLAVTSDSYQSRTAGAPPTAKQRMILHLLWIEERNANNYSTHYMPLVLEDGRYFGLDSLYDLETFDPGQAPASNFDSPALVRAPSIQSGRDGRTVTVAFTSADTRRLNVLEIDSLPAELSRLADRARAQIVDLGSELSYPANRAAFANQVRSKVLTLGEAFHPEVVQPIADRIKDLILGAQGRGLQSVADDARAQIVDLGAKLSGRGLRMSSASIIAPVPIVEVLAEEDARPAADAPPTQLLQFRVPFSRPAPRVGAEQLRVLVSEGGEQVIIGWLEGNAIKYRTSTTDGWTEIREIVLSEHLDLERAFGILQQRVRTR